MSISPTSPETRAARLGEGVKRAVLPGGQRRNPVESAAGFSFRKYRHNVALQQRSADGKTVDGHGTRLDIQRKLADRVAAEGAVPDLLPVE